MRSCRRSARRAPPRSSCCPTTPTRIAVAEAAARTAREEGIRAAVIPTRAQVQGLAAVAVREPGRAFDADVVAMTTAASHTRQGAVTVAAKDAMTMAGPCRVGDTLGIVEGDFALVGGTLGDAAVEVVERLLAGGGELVTLVTGHRLHADDLVAPHLRAAGPDQARGRALRLRRRAAALPAAHRRRVGVCDGDDRRQARSRPRQEDGRRAREGVRDGDRARPAHALPAPARRPRGADRHRAPARRRARHRAGPGQARDRVELPPQVRRPRQPAGQADGGRHHRRSRRPDGDVLQPAVAGRFASTRAWSPSSAARSASSAAASSSPPRSSTCSGAAATSTTSRPRTCSASGRSTPPPRRSRRAS